MLHGCTGWRKRGASKIEAMRRLYNLHLAAKPLKRRESAHTYGIITLTPSNDYIRAHTGRILLIIQFVFEVELAIQLDAYATYVSTRYRACTLSVCV